jgi:hypothetical protein
MAVGIRIIRSQEEEQVVMKNAQLLVMKGLDFRGRGTE